MAVWHMALKSESESEWCVYIQFRKCVKKKPNCDCTDITKKYVVIDVISNYVVLKSWLMSRLRYVSVGCIQLKNNNRQSQFMSNSSLFLIFPAATLKLHSRTPTVWIRDSVPTKAFVLVFHLEDSQMALSWLTPSLANWSAYSRPVRWNYN